MLVGGRFSILNEEVREVSLVADIWVKICRNERGNHADS